MKRSKGLNYQQLEILSKHLNIQLEKIEQEWKKNNQEAQLSEQRKILSKYKKKYPNFNWEDESRNNCFSALKFINVPNHELAAWQDDRESSDKYYKLRAIRVNFYNDLRFKATFANEAEDWQAIINQMVEQFKKELK